MWPNLQRILDATEAFEGKANPELRRMYEVMSSTGPWQPVSLRADYRRRRDELRLRFPDQWVLYHLRMDYETGTSELEVAGAFRTLEEAVTTENALPPDQRRYTVEFVEATDLSVVHVSTPFVADLDGESAAPQAVEG